MAERCDSIGPKPHAKNKELGVLFPQVVRIPFFAKELAWETPTPPRPISSPTRSSGTAAGTVPALRGHHRPGEDHPRNDVPADALMSCGPTEPFDPV